MLDFKRVLDLNCKTEQLNFFNWLSNGSEYAQNVIQWYWNSFFFQKITKNLPAAGGFAHRSPWPPAVIRLNYSTLLYSNTSPNLDIFAL